MEQNVDREAPSYRGRERRKRRLRQKEENYGKLTVIESRIGDECFASWAFQAGISGSGGVANALQVVMPEGRTPGRHDGRDAEVRRFSPFPLCRHPFSADDTLIPIFSSRSLLALCPVCCFCFSFNVSLSLSFSLSLFLSSSSCSLSLSFSFFQFKRNHFISRCRNNNRLYHQASHARNRR